MSEDFEVALPGTQALIDKTKELLRVAKCPNAHCVDGVISEGFAQDYEHFQCQWCAEREVALA